MYAFLFPVVSWYIIGLQMGERCSINVLFTKRCSIILPNLRNNFSAIFIRTIHTIHLSTGRLLSTMPVKVVIMTLWECYLREEQISTHVTRWMVCRLCMIWSPETGGFAWGLPLFILLGVASVMWWSVLMQQHHNHSGVPCTSRDMPIFFRKNRDICWGNAYVTAT